MDGRLPLLFGLALLAVAAAHAAPPATPVVASKRLDGPAIQDAIRDAAKAAVAEMPKLPPAQGPADFRTGDSPSAGGLSKIDQAFIEAEVASCWGPEALKHTPPVVYAAGVPIVLGGLLAVPHVFYAAATGKCK
jgi:hypothetical protein